MKDNSKNDSAFKKYELHLHTKYSRDSNTEPKTALRTAVKRGLDGVAITDHNTMKGAMEAAKIAKKYDIDFVAGEEVNTKFGDVLVYGLQEEIPEGIDFFECIDRAKAQDALAVIAHPFRRWPRNGFKGDFRECAKKADAVEILNARSMWYENDIAKNAAAAIGKAVTGGSDAHFAFEIGNCVTVFPKDIDFRTAVKKKLVKPVSGAYMINGFLGNVSTVLRSSGIIRWTC